MAWKILATGWMAERGIPPDLARLSRYHSRRRRRARTRSPGCDGMLDRWAHRALPRARIPRALPGDHRAAVFTPRRPVLRRELAAPAGRSRRRGMRRRGFRSYRAGEPRGGTVGDAVALH